IGEKQFKTFLLHGITGSGKTQVYIEMIRRTLEKGRQAIVLIPEIVLTPQTLARFQNDFGDKVGVLHSRLSVGEKREVLHKAGKGEFPVIIGPRSAIFAPLPDLGLIVVDEEHESSYKQSDAQPRYHARDVAVFRGRLTNSLVVLGSATPSFESLYNAREGEYEYFPLMQRIEKRALPRIVLVDLKQEWRKNGVPPVVSENLELKIESRLLTSEQVMVLQNRRGYAPYLLCQDCGFILKCPNCEITLTFHQKSRKMVCHYCGHEEKAPSRCPECRGTDIIYKGIGTQKLEEHLNEQFPHARILRMDQDTTGGKHGHSRLLEQFRSKQADILLGTKMIAKGLDFESVTLVGVISADQGLHFPDFRAGEKVFQLLTQAAGRAGRGASSGEVVIQTFDPLHYIFKYLLTHNYLEFYSKEIMSRKNLGYPPFSRLILIRVWGANEAEVENYSRFIVKYLWKANPDRRFSIMGPAPAAIPRKKGNYYFHILIKQNKETDPAMFRVRKILKESLLKNAQLRKWPVRIALDVDPVEIL
ncbi:MAG: primosomal protein N', partial [Calditrichia bacterium]